jgi:hypothetical protein
MAPIEAAVNWRDLVPGGFADDGNFGAHPCDAYRARKAICAAIEAGAPFDNFQEEMFKYMYRTFGTRDPQFWCHAARQACRRGGSGVIWPGGKATIRCSGWS